MILKSCYRTGWFASLSFCFLIALYSPTNAEEAKPTKNLLANPAFELGRQFWDLGKGGKTVASWEINSDDTPAGGQSALITIGKVDSWGVQFGQNLDGGVKGKTYTFAALARSAEDPAKISLQIERRADPYDRAARTDNTTVSKDKWTELHVTFTVDKPFTQGWFAYLSCEQSNAKFRVTNFRLYEGDYVPFREQARQELAVAGVSIFDTGARSALPLAGDVIARREGWTQLPEDNTTHVFKGDAVLTNNRLALVFRGKGSGAELYSVEPGRIVQRSTLRPTADSLALAGFKVLENNPGGGAIEASFKDLGGNAVAMRFETHMGQPFVQIAPDESIKAVRVEAASRYAVMPDFFADDIVVDARLLPPARADLPSDSFLLNLLGDGDAILMSVWSNRQEEVGVSLSGQGAGRHIDSTDIPCGKKEKVWIAVLSAPGIWHQHDIAPSDAGKILPLDWKPPMPAMWRVDWRRDDQLTDSWEMILQRPGGEFLKQRLIGSGDTIPESRKRWNTVLGTFPYPCWIDKVNRASLQPMKQKVHFAGPAVIYPLGRVNATPLDAFSVVDIVRAMLGVGPCEYILDLEGQQGQYKGVATCANRDKLNPIYEKKQQAQRKAEVEKSLSDVILFIRHIRSRVEIYREFGHEIQDYLAAQKKAHPELEASLNELDALAKVIDTRIAARREKIKTPDEAAAMVEAFRQDGLNDVSSGAYEKCKHFTASIVEIGDNQDELAGECRLAVKILRQRAALVQASEPRMAEVAREIRARSQKVLRSPANHEGAGH